MDFGSTQLDAYNGIANVGSSISIRITTMGTYSPSTGSYATHSTLFSTYAIMSDCRKEDWEQIQVGDKSFIIPGYGIPRLDEMTQTRRFLITYRTKNWQPVGTKIVEPGGTVILYKIQARV